MNRSELIKQAYAYGAAVALQELGYAPQVAENMAIKLAEDEGMSPGLRALIGALIGSGAGVGLGYGGAKLGPKMIEALRGPASSAREAIGGAASRAGGAIGGAASRAGETVSDLADRLPDWLKATGRGLKTPMGIGGMAGAGLGAGAGLLSGE